MKALLSSGQATGFQDERGSDIRIGDVLRRYVEAGTEIEPGHGTWMDFRVVARGVVPVLVYLKSEKGQVVAAGSLRMLLSEDFEQRMLLFTGEESLRVSSDMRGILVMNQSRSRGTSR